MLTTLGNKLEPYRADMETIGAQGHLDKLLEANNKFIQLETKCRGIVSARSLANIPSVREIRLKIDAVYRSITDALNVFIKLNGEEPYKSLIADINTLVDKYDAMLAQRQGRTKKQDAANDDEAEKKI